MKKNIHAAIDIGTNTMLLLIAECEKDGARQRMVRILEDQIRFIKLGQGVHQNKAFAPEAMERAMRCFTEFKMICDRHQVDEIHAIATSASRDSKNAKEFYNKVKEKTSIDVRIIDGKTEADLGFLGGLLPGQNPEQVVLMDIGGGSTEFVGIHGGQSLNIGSVRVTEMFLKGDPYEVPAITAMEKYLKDIWERLDPKLQDQLQKKDWVGIAGTPTTLAGLVLGLDSFVSEKVDGFKLSQTIVEEFYEKLKQQTQSERASEPIMGPGRADVMVAGVAILYFAMKYFKKEQLTVSSRGLRHGILLNPSAQF